jgi:ParB family transcriptional regulator, chromosome partitioning protein
MTSKDKRKLFNRTHPLSTKGSKKIIKIAIKDIKVFGGRRSVQSDKVRLIADSMNKIGLKTPITVKKCKTGVRLVAGLHRLKAAKLLGWKKIDAIQMSGSKTDAGLWEDSENLHRAEMKVLERSVKINRWRRHFLKVAKAAQVAGPGGRQPNDAAISVTAKKLGFTRDEISRAKLIAGITPKVQAKLPEYGLDNDQAALLAIAKAPAPKAQRKKLRDILKRKNAPRRKGGTGSKSGKTARDDEQAVLLAELEGQIGEVDKLKRELRAERKKRHKVKKLLAKARSAGAPIAPATISPPTVPTQDETAARISSPSIAPLPVISGDLDIPPFLDRRDPETAFVALKAAWDNAPVAVRSRFVAEVLGIGGDFSGSQTEHP